MSLPQAQLPQGFTEKKGKAFSAAYVEAICQPLKTDISHNILPYLASLFITLKLIANRGKYDGNRFQQVTHISEFHSNPQFFSAYTTDKLGI